MASAEELRLYMTDSDPLPRYIARGVTAALLSLAFTLLLRTLIFQSTSRGLIALVGESPASMRRS